MQTSYSTYSSLSFPICQVGRGIITSCLIGLGQQRRSCLKNYTQKAWSISSINDNYSICHSCLVPCGHMRSVSAGFGRSGKASQERPEHEGVVGQLNTREGVFQIRETAWTKALRPERTEPGRNASGSAWPGVREEMGRHRQEAEPEAKQSPTHSTNIAAHVALPEATNATANEQI